jgi:predicted esterase
MPDSPGVPLLRHAPTTVHGRYLAWPPEAGRPERWLVGFHGQGQTAEMFLGPLARVPHGPGWLLVSVQGLNRFYVGRAGAIAANWMTSQDRELAIADNVAWVDTVLDRLEAEFGAPRAIVFAGFSQGVAMAYRAGLLCRRPSAGIVAGCGDLPPELKAAQGRAWPRVLAAAGTRDDWYTPARLEADMVAIRAFRPDARSLVFEGEHEWSEPLCEAAGRLLADVEEDGGR